jgi:hypothetical protein
MLSRNVGNGLQSGGALLLLLFPTAVGCSPCGSSLTPVQTPQYNNKYINGTAQITVHVLAIHPHNTIQCAYTNTIYLHKYHIPTHYKILTQIRYTHKIQYTYPNTIYLHKYNIPTQIQYTYKNAVQIQYIPTEYITRKSADLRFIDHLWTQIAITPNILC